MVRPLEVDEGVRRDRARRARGVRFHYVVVDYRCAFLSGDLRAGSDAEDAAWVEETALPSYDLPPLALELVRRAFAHEAA